MEDKRKQQDRETDDIKRELDKNRTLDDPGRNVVDYGRSEQAAAEQSKKEQDPGINQDKG
jgi:hypothetical protein